MDSAYVQICYEVNQPPYFHQSHDFQIGSVLINGTEQNENHFRLEEYRPSVYDTIPVDINDIEIHIEQ